MPEIERNPAGAAGNDRDYGIDLGTANTVIYERGRGIVLREPSVIAIDTRTDEVVAAGREAREMLGKTPEHVAVLSPMTRGAVADIPACAAMLRFFMNKIRRAVSVRKPKAMIAVACGLTDVERRAVEDTCRQAGFQQISLFEAPMAAALGAELPVSLPVGSLVLNVGAGISEAAVISLGDVVASATERIGSQDIDEAIAVYVRRKYGLIISRKSSEDIKLKIGSAFEQSEENIAEVRGRSAVDGLPRSCKVRGDELLPVIQPVVVRIAELVAKCLESAPAELAADAFESGIVITGAAAELQGLGDFIAEYTRVKAVLPERPRDCTAEGTGKSLDLVISDRGVRRFRKQSF